MKQLGLFAPVFIKKPKQTRKQQFLAEMEVSSLGKIGRPRLRRTIRLPVAVGGPHRWKRYYAFICYSSGSVICCLLRDKSV